MLEIGSFTTRDCGLISRRSLLAAAGSLPLAWGLPSLVSANTERASGKAKSVVLIWLWGGPSQIDTFDPKPAAPQEIRGVFRAIATRTPGVQFSEIVPKLAERSERLAIVRSQLLDSNHTTMPLTGAGNEKGGKKDPPNFGAIVARGKGGANLPPFVAVTPRTSVSHDTKADTDRALSAGRLGAAYSPFFVRCSPRGELDVSSLKLMDGMSLERLTDRRGLRNELEQLQRQIDGAPLGQYDSAFEGAYELLAGAKAIKTFDLGAESDKTRAAYGRTSFGQSLLLARRLVEAEVPYIHVNWSHGVDSLEEGPRMGWDTHRNGFVQLSNYHGPILDRALAAFLDDLEERGLLGTTLISAFGEMGRTPRVVADGGRDHWSAGFSLWAGGGVQGGRIIGETDKRGGKPTADIKTTAMIGATLCEAIGIDAKQRAQLGVLNGAPAIHDLF
jgi:hypothetical protein